MNHPIASTPHTIGLGDIYYTLFRHKWKILFCIVAGIAAAVIVYRRNPPWFQSDAKLLVRYIITDGKLPSPHEKGTTATIPTDSRGASIMATEKEILNSVDLAARVVESIGAQRLLAQHGGGTDPAAALAVVRAGLKVEVPSGSAVIHISFRHPDQQIVQPVLREVLDQYLKLHVATHRASGMLSDTLAQEADTLRSRLAQTEEDLRKTTMKAGVVSLESAKAAYNDQLIAIRREILNNEAELAGRMAVYEGIRKRQTSGEPAQEETPSTTLPPAVLEEYRTAAMRLARLQDLERELLIQYTPESSRVKQVQEQIAEAKSGVERLRTAYPQLTRMNASPSGQGGPDSLAEEANLAWVHITSLQAKIKELNSQYERLRAELTKLEQVEGQILELRRRKELDEANYRFYAATLEQARISESLGNGKVSNISQIQGASPPYREIANFKIPLLCLLGGIGAGFVWAFLIEFYFDRSIRRPSDLARLPHLPLLLSIPRINGSSTKLSGPKRLELPGPNGSSAPARYEPSNALLPFHETLRDRLIGYFESRNLTHKPKLVAVTGLLQQAGVTTTAAGLARSLSETGDGNVLLIDMTVTQGAAQQFMKGKAVCGLEDMLESRSQAHVNENLYVVSETSGNERLSRNLPKRFASLVPKLKSSDFDYIIFDMPPVSQISITPRLATFMDMVLLVVESEKTDRDLVDGARALLAESKTHVGVVLNKTRTYVPARLQQELMAS